jgi:hypothetical protein
MPATGCVGGPDALTGAGTTAPTDVPHLSQNWLFGPSRFPQFSQKLAVDVIRRSASQLPIDRSLVGP